MAYMKCALSNRLPDEPVVSVVSHRIFERSVIEKYIDEHGTDPISGRPLTKAQLIEIFKDANDSDDNVDSSDSDDDEPRGPTVRSMPELLMVLQGEWEAANKKLDKLEVRKDWKDTTDSLVDQSLLELIDKSCMEADIGNVHPWYEPWHVVLEKLFPLSAGYLVTREFNGVIGRMLLVVTKHRAGKDPCVVLMGGGTLPANRNRDQATKSFLVTSIEGAAKNYMEKGVASKRVYWLGFMGPRCAWGWFEGGQIVSRVEGFWDLLQTEQSQKRMVEMGANLRRFIDEDDSTIEVFSEHS